MTSSRDLMAGFPDLHIEIPIIHHADNAVIVEGTLQGHT